MVDESNLKWLLERQLAWISSADSKAAVLGALPLAMLTISLAGAEPISSGAGWYLLPLLLSSTLLLLSLWFIKAALLPRLSGPAKSRIFFGAIAKMESDEFISDMNSLPPDATQTDLLQQIHRNACIAQHKHQNVSRSIVTLTFATPLWGLSILFGV